jgi:hypothetical protein
MKAEHKRTWQSCMVYHARRSAHFIPVDRIKDVFYEIVCVIIIIVTVPVIVVGIVIVRFTYVVENAAHRFGRDALWAILAMLAAVLVMWVTYIAMTVTWAEW